MAIEDRHGGYHEWHLDTETGELIPLPGPHGNPEALPEELRDRYDRILEDQPDRLRRVPQIPSDRAYRWRVRFAEGVEDDVFGRLLEVALDGKGAFGRFRRVLSDFPETRDRWRRFDDEQLEAEARAGIEELEIKSVAARGAETGGGGAEFALP